VTEPQDTLALGSRCPACGAEVVWDPTNAENNCPYCSMPLEVPQPEEADASVEENDLLAALQTGGGSITDEPQRRSVRCNQCNAVSTWTEEQRSGRCAFCGAPALVEEQLDSSRIAPEGLLPFIIDKKEARKAVKKWIQGLWFRPSDLKKVAQMGQLEGLYVPYWTFDAEGVADYTAQRGDYYYVTRKVGDQTKRERKVRWTSVSGRVHRGFDDVLVCASTGVPQEHIRGVEDWPTESLVPFEQRYLAGFGSEAYTMDLEEGWQLGQAKMNDQLRTDCVHDIGGDTYRNLDMDSSFSNRTYKHCLLPLWIGAYQYRAKGWQVLINGTTGTVDGAAPLSWWKIGFAIATVAAIVFAGYVFGGG